MRRGATMGEGHHCSKCGKSPPEVKFCFRKDRGRLSTVWSTSQPSGARVSDLVAWAKEIVTLYADYEDPPST